MSSIGHEARREWHNQPISATAALLSVILILVGFAVTWGTFSERLENVRRESEQSTSLAQKHEAEIQVLRAQLTTIQAQLLRIEHKLDRDDPRVRSP